MFVNIINTRSSLNSAIVPKPLKIALIKLLLKKNGLDPNLCKNYRPISIFPYISKLLEHVAEESVSHQNQHDLDKFQSEYRPGHSSETAKLRVCNDVLRSADGGDLVLLVLLDVSAAFETTDYKILLTRLYNEVGISTAHQWCFFFFRT